MIIMDSKWWGKQPQGTKAATATSLGLSPEGSPQQSWYHLAQLIKKYIHPQYIQDSCWFKFNPFNLNLFRQHKFLSNKIDRPLFPKGILGSGWAGENFTRQHLAKVSDEEVGNFPDPKKMRRHRVSWSLLISNAYSIAPINIL